MLAEIRSSIDETATPVPSIDDIYRTYVLKSLDDLHASTRVRYRDAYERLIKPRWGRLPVCDITHADLQRWVDTLSYAAAHRCRGVLIRIFRAAFSRGWVDDVATDGLILPATAYSVTRDVLSAADIAALDAACLGYICEPVYILCAHAGLRPGEARAVRPSDIYWHNLDGSRELCVSVTATAADSHAVEDEQGSPDGPTKTRSSARTAIVCGMQDRLWSLAQDAISCGWEYLADDGLGSPITSAVARKDWARLRAVADVPDIPLRNLRPSFITLVHDAGIPLDAVAEQVGHSSPKITAQVYNRPNTDQRATQFARALHARSQRDRSSD